MELDDILFDACRKRKLEVIVFIAKRHPELIAKKDVHANTALHIACENGMPVLKSMHGMHVSGLCCLPLPLCMLIHAAMQPLDTCCCLKRD